ncbi:MAG: hypothetical protein AAB543_04885 [Pseudomonadota bacterium]
MAAATATKASPSGGTPAARARAAAGRPKVTLADFVRFLLGIPSPNQRLEIKIAPLVGDDDDKTATKVVAAAFAGVKYLPARVLKRPFPAEGAPPTPLQFSLMAPLARQALAAEKGDVLVFGERIGDRLYVRFVSLLSVEEDAPDALSGGFPLAVPAEIDDDAARLIRLMALAVAAPAIPSKAAMTRDALPGAVESAIAGMETLRHSLKGKDRGLTLLNFASAAARAGYAHGSGPMLQQAIDAYRAAAEALAREKGSYEWATAQRLLGSELLALAERAGDRAALDAATAALQAATTALSKDTAPRDWGATQHRLGLAFLRRHGETSEVEPLKQSLTFFQAAMHVYTRAEHPQRWADIMNSIGQAGQLLGQILPNADIIERAIGACRQALEIRRRDTYPLFWATTQNTLGSALFALGRMTGSIVALAEAEEAFDGARQAYLERGMDKPALVAERNLTRVRQLMPASHAKNPNAPKSWYEIEDEEEWKRMKGDGDKEKPG